MRKLRILTLAGACAVAASGAAMALEVDPEVLPEINIGGRGVVTANYRDRDLATGGNDNGGELTLAELIDASVGPPGIHDPVYVDFSYSLFECGSDLQPFNTLAEGAAFIQPGGTLYLRGGNSPESVTITTPMTLAAISAVTIGAS